MAEKTVSKWFYSFNILKFWKVQQRDWRVTVVRTSLDRLGYQIVYPFLSIYIVSLGAQKMQLGLFTSIGMILAGLLGPFTGHVIDRNGPKKVYITGIVLLIISYVIYAMAPSWQTCATAMIIYYIGNATGGHSCATICGNCLKNANRAKGMLVCESLAAGLLGMVGPLISAFILVRILGVSGTPSDADTLRPLFFIAAFISLISLTIVIAKLSDRRWSADTEKKDIHLFRDAAMILRSNKVTKKWLVIGTIAALPTGMILPYCQVFAAEMKGANTTVLAGMVTAAALISVVFGYPIGILADKIGRKKVLYMTMTLFSLSNLFLVVAPSPPFLILAGALQGFYYIGAPLSATIQRELVGNEVMGRWIGINRLVTSIFGAAMALVSGIIYDYLGPAYIFLFMIGIDLLIRLPLLISIPETLHVPTPGNPIAGVPARADEPSH